MEVDRIQDWRSKAALRPQYQPIPQPEPNTQEAPKKRKSLFRKRDKSQSTQPPNQQQPPQEPTATTLDHARQERDLQMDSFFDRHKRLRKNLHILHLLHDQLRQNNKAQVGAADEQAMQRCDQIAETLQSEMTRVSARVRQDLTELKQENERLAPLAPEGSGYLRIRQVQHGSLLRQFTAAMSAFQQEQRSGQQQVKESIKRQIRIVDPQVSDTDLDDMADPENAHMLRSSLFAMASKESAQRVLDAVNARRQSMMRVEQGIAQLAQLYNDMYALLEEQQANLDSLETFLESATDYLEKAAAEMDTAVEHQQNIRKAKCMIF